MVELKEDRLIISDYKYPSSLVYKKGEILFKDIQEICFSGPIRILVNSELIFISKMYEDIIKKIVQQKRILVKDRYDIWTSILAPFSDDGVSVDDEKLLEKYKISSVDIKKFRMRYRILRCFQIINVFPGWQPDFTHYDYLESVYILSLVPIFGKKLFNRLYWESMEIALKTYR